LFCKYFLQKINPTAVFLFVILLVKGYNHLTDILYQRHKESYHHTYSDTEFEYLIPS